MLLLAHIEILVGVQYAGLLRQILLKHFKFLPNGGKFIVRDFFLNSLIFRTQAPLFVLTQNLCLFVLCCTISQAVGFQDLKEPAAV